MTTQTFNNLVQEVRRAADIETDGNHITDQEIKDYLNDSLRQVWSIIVNSSGGSLLAKVSPTLVQFGDDSHYYQLPNDFLRLISVDVRYNNTWAPSIEADPQNYAQLLTVDSSGTPFSQHYLYYNKEQSRYELVMFPYRDPNNILVRYIPEAPQLDAGTDVLDLPGDWERWVVYDSAIKCKMKDDEDPSLLLAERSRVEYMIIEDVKAHTPTGVKTIRDVSHRDEWSRFRLPDVT